MDGARDGRHFRHRLLSIAGFIPPPSPAASAAEIARWYSDNLTGIRLGTVVMMFGVVLIAPWSVALAVHTARAERGLPIFACIQFMCVGVVTFTIVLFTLVWAVASFRVGEVSAEITQVLNDTAHFLLLFDWSPFCLWVATFAVVIFRDRGERPVFPRWAGYLNLWVILLSLPGGVLVFFKDGPFAYNGLLACYFVVGVFFVWLVVMTVLGIRATDRGAVMTGSTR
jgi:hypothetical protein